MMNPSPIEFRDEWDMLILGLANPHLLQSWAWGELKAKYGWRAKRWAWHADDGSATAAAQVLFRSVRGGLTLAYCPRGPMVEWDQPQRWHPMLEEIIERARVEGAFLLKIDPGIQLPSGMNDDDQLKQVDTCRSLLDSGWLLSKEQVQFRNTLTLDLSSDEDALLAGMKQKTRYNLRLAERKGVSVREGTLQDLDRLYQMYAETSLRDGFVIRPQAYYNDAWGSFMEQSTAVPLIAEVDGDMVAALVAYQFGRTAYYLYGMSRDAHREKMPNYLLQWEAIRWAKRRECETYDFWGAPHSIDEGESMYGVYRFKQGFGARLVRTPGAWDYPVRPALFRIYSTLMPLILKLMRATGRARTQAQIQDN